MTQEEKAKAYDEAKKVIKDNLDALNEITETGAEVVNIQSIKNCFYRAFPELKESEDERVRKAIHIYLDWLDGRKDYQPKGEYTIRDMIAWLEKQGEQKSTLPKWKYKKDHTPLLRDSLILNKYGCVGKSPSGAIVSDAWVLDYDELAKLPKEELEKQDKQQPADKIEPKFKVGDWVVNPYGDVWHIDSLDGNIYQVSNKGKYNYFPIAKQDEMHLWTFADAKEGDVIVYKDEISLYKHDIKNCTKQETTFGGFVYYCCYDGKRFIMDSLYSLTEQDKPDIHPAAKEQRDLLFQKMKEEGYEWDAEKKELKKIDNEEVNGEDYGIDGLWHAQRILEKTLGSVDGYQSDDGILSHKCAITAVKKLHKQKPTDWSEEDSVRLQRIIDFLWYNRKGDTDAIYQQEQDIDWLKSLKNRVQPHSQPAWSEEDEDTLAAIIAIIRKQYNGTNIEEKKYYNVLINWLKSLKDRVQPQPKQEWSEKDENIISEVIQNYESGFLPSVIERDRIVKALKSLKQKIGWRPSEEQMEALEHFIVYHNGSTNYAKDLEELRLQLKKLMEE